MKDECDFEQILFELWLRIFKINIQGKKSNRGVLKQNCSMNKDLTDCSYEFKSFDIDSGVCFKAYKKLKVKEKV